MVEPEVGKNLGSLTIPWSSTICLNPPWTCLELPACLLPGLLPEKEVHFYFLSPFIWGSFYVFVVPAVKPILSPQQFPPFLSHGTHTRITKILWHTPKIYFLPTCPKIAIILTDLQKKYYSNYLPFLLKNDFLKHQVPILGFLVPGVKQSFATLLPDVTDKMQLCYTTINLLYGPRRHSHQAGIVLAVVIFYLTKGKEASAPDYPVRQCTF